MADLTAANTIIMLTVPGLYDSPVQLQGYSADDVVTTSSVAISETMSGVDGNLSGGYVYAPIDQSFHFQADSISILVVDAWIQTQRRTRSTLPAFMTIFMPDLQISYDMVKGFLISGNIMPDVKKLSQPRTISIRWKDIVLSPINN